MLVESLKRSCDRNAEREQTYETLRKGRKFWALVVWKVTEQIRGTIGLA